MATCTRTNRQTKQVTTVGKTDELAAIAAGCGATLPDDKWATVCQTHGEAAGQPNRRTCFEAARVPALWCDGCAGIVPRDAAMAADPRMARVAAALAAAVNPIAARLADLPAVPRVGAARVLAIATLAGSAPVDAAAVVAAGHAANERAAAAALRAMTTAGILDDGLLVLAAR